VIRQSWALCLLKAQSFTIAPLAHPDDVVEYGNIHDTSHLGRIHSNWPQAFEYLDQEVGIVGMPGYWRFPEAFRGSRWVWTINLVFDNTVLLRKTVR
jgi:hypothetical protein